MKKFNTFFVLFSVLLLIGVSAQELVRIADPIIVFGNEEKPIPTTQMSAFDLVKNFSLAMTPAETMASITKEVTETEEIEERETEVPENERVFNLEILGVYLSLSIQPARYYNPYYYSYGYGWYSYYGWGYGWGRNRPWYWGYYGPYDWRWNWWEWNYWGWYKPRHYRNYNTKPIYASQLKDPRQKANTINSRLTEPNLTAWNNAAKSIKPTSVESQPRNIKSYPSSKIVSRANSSAQQKFDGRISAKYANPKPNRLLQNPGSTPSRTTIGSRTNSSRVSVPARSFTTRSPAPRVSNQFRTTSSRNTIHRPVQSRTTPPRISAPTHSSASRKTIAVRSSAPRSSAVRSSGATRPSTAARTTPRPAPSRGTAVRKK